MTAMLPAIVLLAVVLCWVAFVMVFATQGKPAAAPAQKRDPKSIVGIALQGAGYAIIWIVHRKFFTPIAVLRPTAEIALAVLTITLAVASVWLCAAALRALGKQWSLEARVVAGHDLITEGPYRVVRNPIYTGMLGMLLATALAVSYWIGLVAGLVVFAIGTTIRVRSEERLLRETFGNRWDEYARRVPAVVPFLI